MKKFKKYFFEGAVGVLRQIVIRIFAFTIGVFFLIGCLASYETSIDFLEKVLD